MAASYASHSWTALWQTASSTDWASVRERATTPRISLVALCCSCPSRSSRVSRATSVSWPATEELRAPTDSGALRRFGVTALWRCDLADLPLALERRLIAFPKAQDKAL